MGLPVLVLGQSGTGKSASLRNCSEKDFAVINVAGKPLPFKSKIQCETTDDYRKVMAHLKGLAAQGCRSIVIDDAQYLMANEFMRRATERGYDKFTEIAQNFWSLVNSVKDLPKDVIVYFFAHIEVDSNGNEKIKTVGKLLDEKITVEGMFTIVLKTNVTDGQYSFLTQNNGHDTTKSPIGMFPTYAIDNDLNYVDEKIRNYYELGEFLSDEDMAEIDKMAGKVDFTPKQEGEKKSRRSRRNEKEEKPADTPAEEKKEEAEKPDGHADNSSSEDAGGETTKRRRRRMSEDPERTAVKEENATAVANAGVDDSGEDKEFDEVEKPELKEPQRRKRRGTSATEETAAMNPPEENTEAPTEEAAPRRRRRRG